jgi:hydroxymethylbilane synthase
MHQKGESVIQLDEGAKQVGTGPWVIATRESRLALWQAQWVQTLLQQELGQAVELLGMTTRGDQILDRSLSKVGGKGLFVKELEQALAQGQAHLAVHSLKDVPMDLPEGFELAAVLEREDPRDAWVSGRYASLMELPQGGCVGTSSLRRTCQIRALRPDVQVVPLRGNLDTRLRKLDEGHFDGIVLAAAGLVRLGLRERIRAFFSLQEMVPCAGQGALGLEIRSSAHHMGQALQGLHHASTGLAVLAERSVSRALGGSCSVALAAHAQWVQASQEETELALAVVLGHASDAQAPLLRWQGQARVQHVWQAQDLGLQAARALQAAGAASYIQAFES